MQVSTVVFIFIVALSLSVAHGRFCQNIGYINAFFNHGESSVDDPRELGTWLSKNGWKKVSIPVVGAVAVLQPGFPGVSAYYGHVGRVTNTGTSNGQQYTFSITGTNQGCIDSEWHSACRSEIDCDDVSDWHGLRFNGHTSKYAKFFVPAASADESGVDLPTEPSPQMPAGAGLCTNAHLRVRKEPTSISDEVVVVPLGREVQDLDKQTQLSGEVLFRAVAYINPTGERFAGWASDAYLGPCAMIHYAADVLGPDESAIELARSEVSEIAPVEKLPGWTIGVMSALVGLIVIMLVAMLVLVLTLRHYRRQAAACGAGALRNEKDEKYSDGFVQMADMYVPTVAVMPSGLGSTA